MMISSEEIQVQTINHLGLIAGITLDSTIPELVKLSTSELTPLLLSLSREELLTRFSTFY